VRWLKLASRRHNPGVDGTLTCKFKKVLRKRKLAGRLGVKKKIQVGHIAAHWPGSLAISAEASVKDAGHIRAGLPVFVEVDVPEQKVVCGLTFEKARDGWFCKKDDIAIRLVKTVGWVCWVGNEGDELLDCSEATGPTPEDALRGAVGKALVESDKAAVSAAFRSQSLRLLCAG
jgi:hypothetical protein